MTPQQIAETLGRFPVATIYEAAGKRGDMSPNIRPVVPAAEGAEICDRARRRRRIERERDSRVREGESLASVLGLAAPE